MVGTKNQTIRWYEDDLLEVLFDEATISRRVQEMGEEITNAYRQILKKGERIVLIGLLKGSYMFLSDLSKAINLPIQIDVMSVKSYAGQSSTGTVKLLKDLEIDTTNVHILICEDLIDTGNTLSWLQKHLESKDTASVKICTFIQKKTERRKVDINIDFYGFECEDKFIVGYGMDFNERYRNLPIIGVLKPKMYECEE